MEKPEKRQTTRIPVPVYLEAFDEAFPVGILRNVSSDGMFVQSTEPKEIGTRMDLSFKLPDSDNKIQVKAEVVRVSYPLSLSEAGLQGDPGRPVADNPGMGLRVLSASTQDLASLKRFLQGSEPPEPDEAG
jgi:hypothetical protein